MANIVILGAGLTGISTAYHLEQKGFFDYKLFEKETAIGGLCRSVEQDGFTFDFTGHLLHAANPYFYQFLEQVIGLEKFNSIIRRSYIYSNNVFTEYPFQINLADLPINVITECIEGFIKRPRIKSPKSFLDWVLTNFGSGFAKHFFLPYQEKIFNYNLAHLTASWTQNFVPQTTLTQIIERLIKPAKEQSIGYNAQFFYPQKGGIVSWIHQFATKLFQPLYTNHEITKVDTKNKIIEFSNGETETYKTLITTVPLTTFLTLIKEPSNSALKNAIPKLLCNKVINFNLGINKPDVSSKHWVYFPEKNIPFYRLGFPHNLSPSMAPKDCSSLYGEFSHINKSSTWVKNTLTHARAETIKLLNISKNDIATEKVISIEHAYVIYDKWRDAHLPRLLSTLEDLQIYSIGRYGAWKYASMQDAVLDGQKIAHQLLFNPAISAFGNDFTRAPYLKEHSKVDVHNS